MGVDLLAEGSAALGAGRWSDAVDSFRAALEQADQPRAHFGIAVALWWLGDNRAAVDACTTAYAAFRRLDDLAGAVECAVWLSITYKSNFDNAAAANGWLSRADRLLDGTDDGVPHGWVRIARAYRHPDLELAARLSEEAVEIARRAGDLDLELVAMSHLGLVRVGLGESEAGFALIDEATAAALGGEGSTLDTVVYTCCDMLNACELADDLERAAEWCAVADRFVETYGCPFLYAECRIFYGSVLTARGHWDDADRELRAGLKLTEDSSPGLHARALVRLSMLRMRQGRFEEAEELLAGVEGELALEIDAAVAVAAMALARGDVAFAGRHLERHVDQVGRERAGLAVALGLLVETHLRLGQHDEAEQVARVLTEFADRARDDRARAHAAAARGHVAAAAADRATARACFEEALAIYIRLQHPYEKGLMHLEMGAVWAEDDRHLAIEHARAAFHTFDTLGAKGGADRAAGLLRTLGEPGHPGTRDVGVLTRREREVLRLVGLGLSNPEIAARLHVSRKTASHHVSSILRKLGVRNRIEAAAFAAQRPAGLD